MTETPTTRPVLDGRPHGMTPADGELLDAACALLDRRYEPGRHEVASAMRAIDGTVHLGLHIDGSARRSTVCAEGVALGNAVAAGPLPVSVEAVVSVLRRPNGSTHVIEPCGVCSELLSDYVPDARVWITNGDRVFATTAAELLPAKRIRAW